MECIRIRQGDLFQHRRRLGAGRDRGHCGGGVGTVRTPLNLSRLARVFSEDAEWMRIWATDVMPRDCAIIFSDLIRGLMK
jgi:hypothetical protein